MSVNSAAASTKNSFLHEGRFCSGAYSSQANGVEGFARKQDAQSIDLYLPDKKGGYAIAVYSTVSASTRHDYMWIKVKKGWGRVCVSFLDEGSSTPARKYIDRTSHEVWFSKGRGLEGNVKWIRFYGWPEYPDRPPPANFVPPK